MITLVGIIVLINSSIFAAPVNRHETSNIIVTCGEQGDCLSASTDCNQLCGCDNLNYYNETLNECVLNSTYLRALIVEHHNSQERIRQDAENVFNGIIVSVFIYFSCAIVCVSSACIYCCRINYTDQKLSSDVKALAKKLQRDGKLTKPGKKKTEAVAESCNVVVEDAGVFVC